MSDAEHGIFQAQAKAASEQLGGKDGLRELQNRGGAYLDDRIYVAVLVMGVIGVFLVWATSDSSLVQYGSLALVIGLTFLWGLARIRRIDRVRRERQLEAQLFEAQKNAPATDE